MNMKKKIPVLVMLVSLLAAGLAACTTATEESSATAVTEKAARKLPPRSPTWFKGGF